MLDIEFPKKLSFLLKEPARLKILYGGRGGGKSINSVRAAIIFDRIKKLEIVCFRELQKSIQESLHGVICNEIETLGLTSEFTIQNAEIVHNLTGSRFTFEALRYNISKIKSRARIDIALLEEADNISKTSLDILMPTVRSREYSPGDYGGPFGKGPEVWILFNPKTDTDEVYKRFVLQKEKFAPNFDNSVNADDEIWYLKLHDQIYNGELKLSDLPKYDQIKYEQLKQKRYAIVCKINYSDNKWFPDDLRREMEILKINSPDDYMHVWEGNTKQVIEGAVYAEEIKKVLLDGRRKHVPYNPNKAVYTYWDIGYADKTAIWFVQHAGVEYNVIRYYENQLQKMPFYIQYLQSLGYNYGVMNLPHDGDAETQSNITPRKQLQDVGYKVRIIKRPNRKMIGINAVRTLFDLLNFDEENTADGWQCLCRYAFKVDETDGVFSREPDHDTPWSHGADGMQTFGLSIKPEQELKKPRTVTSGRVLSMNRDFNSWMGS